MELVLTTEDKASALAQKLSTHYLAKLQELRNRNDFPMDDSNRQILIARIQEVKALIHVFAAPSFQQVNASLIGADLSQFVHGRN